ncbi:ABC transporter permease [Blastococcus sp. TBT05-19]|uniref:ABC transporter permease n=1 Tax=Blastococcus sp. TBT05-19 TaxID=2250581 RepID=UPI000DEA3C09|nr:ABC transporter permease [Blastococcus sp. TBT05-19]RBY87249.1 ABC transporter permease [Blastococcus sp. TBT05-19]
MTALVRAEWTKLFTTRVWLGLLVGACVMVIGFAVLLTAFAGNPEADIPAVGTPLYEELAMANVVNVNVLFLILGIIGMTQEYRHRTATPTFLTTPHRGRVVIAKLVAYALAATLFALVVAAVNVATLAVHAGARGAAPELDADNLGTLGSSALALVIYAVIGVGLGALLRNQVGAIVGGLVYLFVVEPLIRQIPATSGAYKWMPGGGLEALTATFQGPDLLEPWQGGVLLLGYGLVAALLGTFLAVRRDVA